MSRDLWPFILEVTYDAFTAALQKYQSTHPPLFPKTIFEEFDVTPDSLNGVGMMLEEQDAENVSLDAFLNIFPFDTAVYGQNAINAMLDAGLIEVKGGDVYRVSEKGRQVIARMTERRDRLFTALTEYTKTPVEDLQRVTGYFRHIAEAYQNASKPASRFNFTNHLNAVRPDNITSDFLRLMRARYVLGAFRRDCHHAAWRKHGVSAEVWEVLTYLYRDNANTPEALKNHRYLSFRPHTLEDYAGFLETLADLGWTERDASGEYRLTEVGRSVWESTEQEVDDLFYPAWSVLSEDELADLRHTLECFRELWVMPSS